MLEFSHFFVSMPVTHYTLSCYFLLIRSLCLVLILPIWLLGIDCLILRLPCQTEALFTIYKRGRFLPNASLQYLPLATYNQCVARCIEHPKCKSFNHRMNSTGCTLNSKYAGMFGTSLVAMANWSYASTDYKATKVSRAEKRAKLCHCAHAPSQTSKSLLTVLTPCIFLQSR